MAVTVKIVNAADGSETIHDGRYVVEWDSNVPYGTLSISSSISLFSARIFNDSSEALIEWNSVSNVEPLRPDGEPNKPLTAVSILVEHDKHRN